MKRLMTISLSVVWLVAAPSVANANGATARAQVSAEVVEPTTIDFRRLLSAAPAGMKSPEDTGPAAQSRAAVSIVTVKGVTYLTIDFN